MKSQLGKETAGAAQEPGDQGQRDKVQGHFKDLFAAIGVFSWLTRLKDVADYNAFREFF